MRDTIKSILEIIVFQDAWHKSRDLRSHLISLNPEKLIFEKHIMQKQVIYFLLTLLLTFSFTDIQADVLFELDFSNAKGDVENWFEDRGWEIKGDLSDIKPRFESGRLILEPIDDDTVLIGRQFNKKEYLSGVRQVKIVWGMEQYPKGADWSGPKKNEIQGNQ